MPVNTETNSVQGAVWTTAYVDSLPNSSFAWVSDDGKTRKLPYKNADGKVDLPHTRNALARLDNTQGIPAGEKDKIRTKLQNALKNAKASDSDDIVLQTRSAIQASEDGQTLPDRVHLLREGEFHTQKYGKVPVTADDIHGMVNNFQQGVGMPNDGKETGIPIDFSHKSGDLAAAWIHNLEAVQGDDGFLDLYGTQVEWSRAGREAVLGKEFKYISADFYPAAFGEWVDPESGIVAQSVMVGAGLTNRPMFTGNKAVMASEEDPGEAEATGVKTVIYVNATNEIKEKSMNLDQLRVKAADDVTGAEQRFLQAHAAELSADERKKFEVVAPVTADDTASKEKDAAIKAAEVQAAELKAANDKIAALEASITPLQESLKASEKREAEAFVDEQVSAGKIVASQKDEWVKRILADESTKELLAALPENKLLGKKQGSSANASDISAREQQMAKAKEIMAAAPADQPIDITTAMRKAAEQDPTLAKRVLDENRALAGVNAAA